LPTTPSAVSHPVRRQDPHRRLRRSPWRARHRRHCHSLRRPCPLLHSPQSTFRVEATRWPDFKIPEDTPAIAKVTYGGSSNFAIAALAADGSTNDLLVNEIGKYTGTVLFDEDVGVHSVAFEITASGKWTIRILPVTSSRPWNTTEKLTGKGDDVVLAVPPTGAFTTATIKHSGESNFAVIAYGAEGSDLVVNEIGNYSGQVVLPDGTLLLEVTADGAWTVALD
jgi:hypothetical protein